MKNYLIFKYVIALLKEYIFIFLTATIFLFTTNTKTFSKENIFAINNVKVNGEIDLNFSREKYLNRAFKDSFEVLMSKILLTRDLQRISNISLKEIKKLISSFQILEESYSKDEYKASYKILYNDLKVKKFLSKKNISFSQSESISAVFYPVLFINGEIQNFNENFFYKNWDDILIKNEIINFILPLEDLEEFSEITKMKNEIEKLDIKNLINRYDVKNYVFALIEYQDKKLNVHLKTNFVNNKLSKNFFYEVEDINNESSLNLILKDLKLKITDLWKEQNLINILMPLSIKLKFQHLKLRNLNKLINTLHEIDIIDNFKIKEFDINNSFFKIYYYGDPKKLKSELFKYGYQLSNNQGFWQIYLNE